MSWNPIIRFLSIGVPVYRSLSEVVHHMKEMPGQALVIDGAPRDEDFGRVFLRVGPLEVFAGNLISNADAVKSDASVRWSVVLWTV